MLTHGPQGRIDQRNTILRGVRGVTGKAHDSAVRPAYDSRVTLSVMSV